MTSCNTNIKNSNFVDEISISYTRKQSIRTTITGVVTAEKALRGMWNKKLINIQEQFCVLFLNAAHEVIGFRCLSSGTTNSTTVDFKLLFGLACKTLASKIIVAHNHPSGNLKPSNADIHLTSKIKEAGELLGVGLLDHIILTQDSYTSLLSEKLI